MRSIARRTTRSRSCSWPASASPSHYGPSPGPRPSQARAGRRCQAQTEGQEREEARPERSIPRATIGKTRHGRSGRAWNIVAHLADLCEPFEDAIEDLPLDRLVPPNAEEARQRLGVVIEQMIRRLEPIRARLAQIAAADAASAAARLAIEPGIEADRQRRYGLARDRQWIRTIDEFLKVRKADANVTIDDEIDHRPGRSGRLRGTPYFASNGFDDEPKRSVEPTAARRADGR